MNEISGGKNTENTEMLLIEEETFSALIQNGLKQ